jgi:ABC-type dipeptide/oligopeptide/nickel transport system ATPase component
MSTVSTLVLPTPANAVNTSALTPIGPTNSVVIIGANGSGKTRLGAWLEFTGPQNQLVHRVGAQKALNFPDSASPVALEAAQLGFTTGVSPEAVANSPESDINLYRALKYRINSKWNGDAAVGVVNDFKNLLTYLISEQFDSVLEYAQKAKGTTAYSPPPDTKLDRIKYIWERVISHRQLINKASSVSVKPTGSDEAAAYKASMMSDGERVTFYLIGQCIAVPPNGIIVIDEPEVHLHRVIQTSLWNAIEQERPDCLFVYITHDLEFAASRTGAKKIWLKSYSGAGWDWKEVPESGGIPEELLLAVLGSRKPVLFTEGDRSSSEQAIFSRVYPGWTIMPCGNCEQVIASTKAFTDLKHLHGNECRGIIDRDYRTDQEVADLQAKGIHVLDVQEVENLLLVEDVLTAVVNHALDAGTITGTVDTRVAEIKAHFFQLLAQDQQLLTSRRAGWEIEKTMRKFDAKAVGLPALQAAVQATAALDVASIYADIDAEFTRIRTEPDYPALLKLYNNKGLAKQAGRFFGIQVAYPEFVKRLISGGKGETIVQALRAACPVLPVMAAASIN